MKILVTGANGLLGQKLCALLIEDKSVELIATTRNKLNFDLINGSFAALDVTNQASVNKVLGDIRPDVIIHTAAMTQVDQCETEPETCWTNNVTALEYLTQACEANGIHIVHVSTDFIFDGTHGPLDEEAIPNPISHYGKSKLAAEEIIKKSKASWSILRTVLVYGVTKDMSRSNIVLWVKKNLEEGKTINVVNDQWRTPTLAEDLAMGCYLAAKNKANGVYNISGDEMMTPHDIAIATATFFKLDKSLIKPANASNFTQPAKRPAKTGFIIRKAENDLGYHPHSFVEGLSVVAAQLQAR